MLNTIAAIYGTFSEVGDYQPISTTTVGAGGAASISFTSIPAGYQTLQLRLFGRTTSSTSDGNYINVRFNSDSGSNYTFHQIQGDGSSVTATALTSQTQTILQRVPSDAASASVYGVIVCDIVDYAATTKYKTLKAYGGFETNSGAASGTKIFFTSGAWLSSSAISSMSLTPDTGNFKQYTSAALYGIKG